MAKSRVPKRLSRRRRLSSNASKSLDSVASLDSTASSTPSGQIPSTSISRDRTVSNMEEKVSNIPAKPYVNPSSSNNDVGVVDKMVNNRDPVNVNRVQSDPRPMVPPTTQVQPSRLQTIVHNINQSKYFAGIIMILMNMGSRYISLELSERHESILGHPMVRRLMLFTVFFTATRDVWISLGLTACFVILVTGIFHDESRFCMIPERYRKGKKGVTKSDIEKAERVLALARQQQEQGQASPKTKSKGHKVKTEKRQENTRVKRTRRQKQDMYYLHNLENFRNFRK